MLINSTVLQSVHGFSTRAGGVSTGSFSSLNTSYLVGDDAGAVAENLRRLEESANTSELLTISQVHGTTIVRDPAPGTEADGLFTERPGIAVGVRTADCLPVLIEDPISRRVAAVHAGWRGVIGGIAPKTVELFVGLGSRADQLRVAAGPAIQKCCFEVDGDLPTRFSHTFGPRVVVGGYAKPHLDLGFALRASLEGVGVRPENLEVMAHCTHCDPRFFSHRRDRGLTGRHLSFIACGSETDL